MSEPVRGTDEMIAAMAPRPLPGTFVFVTLPGPNAAADLWEKALGSFREAEGLSLILALETAKAAGLPTKMQMRCITLTVHSALDGVGLTAAVAEALAAQDIPCNVVAAFHHDHVFVPAAQVDAAMDALASLQNSARDKLS